MPPSAGRARAGTIGGVFGKLQKHSPAVRTSQPKQSYARSDFQPPPVHQDSHGPPGHRLNSVCQRDGLHLCSERVVDCLQSSLLKVIVYECDEPYAVVGLPYADTLTRAQPRSHLVWSPRHAA